MSLQSPLISSPFRETATSGRLQSATLERSTQEQRRPTDLGHSIGPVCGRGQTLRAPFKPSISQMEQFGKTARPLKHHSSLTRILASCLKTRSLAYMFSLPRREAPATKLGFCRTIASFPLEVTPYHQLTITKQFLE